MKELVELLGDTEAAGWIPTEAWADLILEASVCESALSGKITAVDYDLAAGNGSSVLVRSFPARTAQGPFHHGCTCLTACSSTLAHAHITIYQWGDYENMCEFTLWKAKGPVKEGILNEFAKGLAVARDAYLLTVMGQDTTGTYKTYRASTNVSYTSTASWGYCCWARFDLYNSICSVMSHMRGACLKPDTIIISPEVAYWFYVGDRGGEHGLHVGFDGNDRLINVAGMKVIETGTMAAPLTTGKITLCYVIDSSRAVGEAWGKRPTFTETYVNDCDYWKEVVWQYWGAGVIDATAIGAVYSTH